jgi:hypothetical protein
MPPPASLFKSDHRSLARSLAQAWQGANPEQLVASIRSDDPNLQLQARAAHARARTHALRQRSTHAHGSAHTRTRTRAHARSNAALRAPCTARAR